MNATEIQPKTAKIVTPKMDVFAFETPHERTRVVLSAQETGGQFMVGQTTVEPGSEGPPMHSHAHEDELWIITEGRFEFIVNGEATVVGPGAVVYSPAGDVHRFRCIGETPGKFTLLVTGDNFQRFFGTWMDALGRGDMGTAMQAAANHGITFHGSIGEA